MEVAVLIGIQGAGKSTFAQRQLGATHVRLSRDVLRTPQRERVLQHACLSVGQAFVADNTHPDRAARTAVIALARAAEFRVVGYYFVPDVAASKARNAARAGRSRVPDVAVHATLARLELPAWDEGFDQIFHVVVDGETYRIEEVLREAR